MYTLFNHIVAANKHIGWGVMGGCRPATPSIKWDPFCQACAMLNVGWNSLKRDCWKEKRGVSSSEEKAGPRVRGLIEHNFQSCLYRVFRLTIASHRSPLRVSPEPYVTFLLKNKGLYVFFYVAKIAVEFNFILLIILIYCFCEKNPQTIVDTVFFFLLHMGHPVETNPGK